MFNYTNAQLLVLKVQGYKNREGKDGENKVNSDVDEDSMSDDEGTDIKDGVFLLVWKLCCQIWDCVNIYLVENPVSYPYCIRLGFKLMCVVEKGQ
eukprot:5617444-Ditylum_brightwellii.AAC.1